MTKREPYCIAVLALAAFAGVLAITLVVALVVKSKDNGRSGPTDQPDMTRAEAESVQHALDTMAALDIAKSQPTAHAKRLWSRP